MESIMFQNNIKDHSWNNAVCLVRKNEEFSIIDVTESFASLIDPNIESIKGKSLISFFSDAGKISFIQAVNDSNSNGTPYYTIEFNRVDGVVQKICIHLVFTPDSIFVYVVDPVSLLNMQKNMFNIMNMIPCGFIFYVRDVSIDPNSEYKFEYANDTFYDIIGYSKEEFEAFNCNLFSLPMKKNKRSAKNAYKRAISVPGHSFAVEHSITDSNGNEKYVSSYIARFFVSNMDYIIITFSDISQKNYMEEQMRYLMNRNKLLIDIAEESIFEYDIPSDSFTISETKIPDLIISPYKVNMFKTGSAIKVIHPDDFERCKNRIIECKSKEVSGTSEIRLLMKNGEYKWYKMNYASMSDSDNKIFKVVGRLTDIDEEKKANEAVHERLLLDPMTGLYNKTATKIKAEEFFVMDKRSDNKTHACIVVDIDNFKHVNDTFGHMFGDIVIENIANAIKTIIRENDIAGRVGGDEFVVILKDISKNMAITKAESIRKEINNINLGTQIPFTISASIGLSMYGVDGTDYNTLFKKADTAMYYSKKSTKNIVSVYDPEVHKIIGENKDRELTEFDSVDNDYDKQFVQYIYSVLINSKDFDSSLNALFERIGKRYDLSVVSLFDNNDEENIMYETNKWTKENGIVTRGYKFIDYSDWNGFTVVLGSDKVISVDDCLDDTVVTKTDMEVFKMLDMRAVVNCRIFRPDLNTDLIFAFTDAEKSRKWSDYEKTTLYQTCLTIAFFIFVRNSASQKTDKIERLYMYDRLTGVYNFDSFLIKGNELLKIFDEKKYYALMYSDILGFSHVNESLGYEVGDDILINYGSLINEEDKVKYVCRLHSDLFANIIIANSKDEAIRTIERIRTKFSNFLNRNYPTSGCRLNIGVYHIPDNSRDISYAFDCAELARRYAKSYTGKTYTMYSEEMRWDRNNEQNIVTSLNSAIEGGDIVIYLQPKINMCTNEVIGAESLVRWKNATGGVNMPDTFIPALERLGSIVDLDFYAFEETLKLLKRWKSENKKSIKISANFSRKHNTLPDFVERIVNLTEKYNVDVKDIEIEVTESCLADDSKVMYKNLQKLKDMGYSISMDDFGTGYSSLDLLLSAPVDTVKIDKSFLKKFEEGSLSKEYIIKICELIRITGKEIVFEGVENQNQLDFLVENGCHIGQGYFFSRPIAIEKFEELYF